MQPFKFIKGAGFMGLLCLLAQFAQGQSMQLTLPQLLDQANTRNAQLQLAGLNVQAQQALRPSARDIGRLNVVGMLGQYNSRKFDNNLMVSHTLPNPQFIRQSVALADAQIAGRQQQVSVSQNEVRYQLRSSYYELVYLHEKTRLFREQDSLLAVFVQVAGVRVRTGEAAPLESAAAISQRILQRTRINQHLADVALFRANLQTLLNTVDSLDVAPARLTVLPVPLGVGTDKNPVLALLQQQINIASANRAVEQARLKPDFLVGLFSQTLIGTQMFNGQDTYYNAAQRFFGGQVGVSFPLVAAPQRAKVEAARVGEQIAQTERQNGQRSLEIAIERAARQYAQYRAALTDYEQNGLPAARQVAEKAAIAFRAGDIGYVEFSLALQQTFAIRLAYLDTINLLNQRVIELNYLLGE